MVELSESLSFAILIVEQNVSVAFEAAKRTIVLERGAVVREGTAEALRHDPDLTRLLAI